MALTRFQKAVAVVGTLSLTLTSHTKAAAEHLLVEATSVWNTLPAPVLREEPETHFEFYDSPYAVGRASVAAQTTSASGELRLFDYDGIRRLLE